MELNNKRIRWRKRKNGMSQGIVLAPILFNIYTNDQAIHDGTRSFIYADDLCITSQNQSFKQVEETIEEGLEFQKDTSCTRLECCTHLHILCLHNPCLAGSGLTTHTNKDTPVIWICDLCHKQINKKQTSIRCNHTHYTHWVHLKCTHIKQ